MFRDSPVKYVEFQSGQASDARRDKSLKNAQIQTEPFLVREGGIQTVRRKEHEVQTELSASTSAHDGVSEYYDDGAMDMPNDDPTSLNNFVRRVGPLLLSELEANVANLGTNILLGNWATASRSSSHRQIEVDAYGFAIVEDSQNQPQQNEEGCTLLRRVFGPVDGNATNPSDFLPASCLSWSPSGATLAVGFGHIRHDSWCAHGTTSAVYVWSLESFRSGGNSVSSNDPEKQLKSYPPIRTLPHSACVTAVSFHPTTAGLLASGSFTGDVVVWDISRDDAIDPLLASTAGLALTQPGMNIPHTDFIGSLQWLPFKASATTRCLASACGDGLVCTWSIELIRRTITQLAGYKFSSGVCCLSLNPHDSTILAAGLANGQLVLWSLVTSASQSPYALDSGLSTPSTPVYRVTGSKISASSGPIYGCEWSPACPGLCAIATSDGTVLLYSQREPTVPCMRLESSNSGSLFSICFSRSRPLLLLSASQYDGVISFDLSSSRASSALFRLQSASSQLNSNNQTPSTLCAAFNPGAGRSSAHLLIAVGRETGAVELWRVSLSGDTADTDSAAALQSLRALVLDSPDKHFQQELKPKKEKVATTLAAESTKKKKKKQREEQNM